MRFSPEAVHGSASFGPKSRTPSSRRCSGGGDPLWDRHDEAVLFTTVEPCPLCLGAAVMADLPHIVFAHPDPAIQSAHIIDRVPYVRSHIETYLRGVLRDDSRALFERYEPRMLAWLDDQVLRHRQAGAPD